MSLQLVAQHLAQKSRSPDSTLVHMSNREVAGLNALAKKHGGELSVNPDTGLPEAGFLDSILPAVAGAGLTYLSGGALSPLMSAGIVGGLTALDSKDLSKGLMAGLGAWGGGEMVGGLAGLGAASTGANEAARQAAVNGAIENGTYQSAVGAGTREFAAQPMASLSNLGGGSVIKGSLPILAGLAPAAADMLGEEDEGDGAPAQHKGYIRKYALDPVTGQYKQVGVYEAGGDPNKDVSSEAGTAGSFGGVGQSEYQKAHGMASGGATDSSRIYDYLMGRGENPMQFRHTTAPQVKYETKAPELITPTTPILDPQYDQYGNVINRISGGGGQDSESREAQRLAAAKYFDSMTPEQREEHAATLGKIGNFFSMLAPGAIPKKIYDSVAGPGTYIFNKMNADKMNVPNLGTVPSSINEGTTGEFEVGFGQPTVFGGYPVGTSPNPYSMGPGTPGFNAPTTSSAESEGNAGEQAARNYMAGMAEGERSAVNEGPSAPSEGRSAVSEGNAGEQNARNYQAAQAEGERSAGETNERSFGNGDARGGYLQHGQFDQRMAHGGISGHLRPPQPFYANGKFSYKGPQVYADGGIAALAQRYDDGGMTLPLKAQPINNLGSMHPKSLQAAYERAVATNDVAGARKYQNELGLRSKLQNPQIYADGGETGGYNLGSYSDGGRLLKGPGDGVSDDIPATIGHGQPARLADGEFVIPARIVSEIGNGSTDAGARELYKMMDRIQAGRAKTVGKDQVARNSKAVRHLPA